MRRCSILEARAINDEVHNALGKLDVAGELKAQRPAGEPELSTSLGCLGKCMGCVT
jgi:hypothetical protein